MKLVDSLNFEHGVGLASVFRHMNFLCFNFLFLVQENVWRLDVSKIKYREKILLSTTGLMFICRKN